MDLLRILGENYIKASADEAVIVHTTATLLPDGSPARCSLVAPKGSVCYLWFPMQLLLLDIRLLWKIPDTVY